jgi:predicted outer membrane repeat protein
MSLHFSSPLVTGSSFHANSAHHGGAVYLTHTSEPTLVNCAAVGNTAYSGGGGYASPETSLTLINSTLSGNSAFNGGGIFADSAVLTISNSILWASSTGAGSQIFQSNTVTTIEHSDVQGGASGDGNLDVDPRFIRNPTAGPDGIWGTPDDDAGDLGLQTTSPCIDAGNNTAVPASITTDLAGNARFTDFPAVHDPGAIVDLGAYEAPVALAAEAQFLFDAPLPSVRVAFNANLLVATLAAADLVLSNLTTATPVDCAEVATLVYDAGANSATWMFPGLLPNGDYRATLPAGSVGDASGGALGLPYTFDFFVLAGDANRDRSVDVADLGILATNWQKSSRAFSQGNFNYSSDGYVNVNDLGVLAGNWQAQLALPLPSRLTGHTRRIATDVLESPATRRVVSAGAIGTSSCVAKSPSHVENPCHIVQLRSGLP